MLLYKSRFSKRRNLAYLPRGVFVALCDARKFHLVLRPYALSRDPPPHTRPLPCVTERIGVGVGLNNW